MYTVSARSTKGASSSVHCVHYNTEDEIKIMFVDIKIFVLLYDLIRIFESK